MLQSETVRKYDTYKDSGIEWIGKIPQNWNVRKLFGLLKSIGSGTTPKGNDSYYDGDIPWLNTGDLTDSYVNIIGKTVTDIAMTECSALKLFDKNSVVIAMYGATIGKLGIITFPTTTNQACCVMSCSKSLYNKYLFYVLYSARDYILTLSYGAGQPNISQETMKSFKLCCPDVVEQQKIADYLDKKCGEIDRVIETKKLVIEKLKEYKQSIITEAVTKGLDKSVPLKDSGIEWIGQIPQNWKVLKFSNIAKVKSNLVNPNEYLSYYQISPENIEKDTGNLLNNFCSVEESGVISGNHLFFKGQILYSKIRPNLNKVTIAPFDGLCSADMYPIETDVNTNYFLYTMLSDTFVSQVKLYIENRVKMPKINQNELSNIYVAIPNDSKEQELIAEYLDKKCSEIDKAIANKEQVVEKFTEYKKSLIYECVTGKRKVV